MQRDRTYPCLSMGEVSKNWRPYFRTATPGFMLIEVFCGFISVTSAWKVTDFGIVLPIQQQSAGFSIVLGLWFSTLSIL